MLDAETAEQRMLDDALEALTRTRGVLAAVLATEEGFLLAARLSSEQDGQALAGAAAAIARSSRAALLRLGRGELQVAMLEASKLTLLVCEVRRCYLLAVAEPQANVGLIAMEMNAAVEHLREGAAALLEG